MDVLIAILWFAFSIVVSIGAEKRGRCSACWLLWSFMLSPLVMGLMLMILGPKERFVDDRDLDRAVRRSRR
jgi:hypothetical protein